MQAIRHYLLAVQFFTRIPVSGPLADWVGYSPAMLRASAAHFPGVGWLIGALAALCFGALSWLLGMGPPFTPLVAAPRLAEALVVQLVDAEGGGLADRAVTWVVSSGGGQVSPTATTTDADGFARAQWTLGTELGTHTVEAVVSHVGVVTFTATASEGEVPPGSVLEPIEGDGQTAPAGAPVPVRPAVRVTLDGEPVAGVAVTFAVTGGGGSIEGAAQVTNGDGIARVGAWVLGTEPGTNRLTATAEGVESDPVVFTAEATSGSGVDRMVFVVAPPSRVEMALRPSMATRGWVIGASPGRAPCAGNPPPSCVHRSGCGSHRG